MQIRSALIYEARIAFGMTSLLAALILPGYALLGFIHWRIQDYTPDQTLIAMAFEFLLPLSAGLLAAHLMSVERDANFDTLRRSYPESSWKIPLVRASGAILLIVIAATLGAFIFRLSYEDYTFLDVFIPALPPALFLMTMALLVNNIAGNYWVAVILVIAYWFLEYQTQGNYTGIIFLFHSSIPKPGVDYDLNRWLLFGTALTLLLLNGLYSNWRRRRGG